MPLQLGLIIFYKTGSPKRFFIDKLFGSHHRRGTRAQCLFRYSLRSAFTNCYATHKTRRPFKINYHVSYDACRRFHGKSAAFQDKATRYPGEIF